MFQWQRKRNAWRAFQEKGMFPQPIPVAEISVEGMDKTQVDRGPKQKKKDTSASHVHGRWGSLWGMTPWEKKPAMP